MRGKEGGAKLERAREVLLGGGSCFGSAFVFLFVFFFSLCFASNASLGFSSSLWFFLGGKYKHGIYLEGGSFSFLVFLQFGRMSGRCFCFFGQGSFLWLDFVFVQRQKKTKTCVFFS